jgi:hypothetical protein
LIHSFYLIFLLLEFARPFKKKFECLLFHHLSAIYWIMKSSNLNLEIDPFVLKLLIQCFFSFWKYYWLEHFILSLSSIQIMNHLLEFDLFCYDFHILCYIFYLMLLIFIQYMAAEIYFYYFLFLHLFICYMYSK